MTTNTKLSTILILGLSASSLAACTSYRLNYKNPSAQRGTKHSVKQNFFLWGFVGGSEVDLAQLCPTGVAEIASQSGFVDGLLFGLTGGLYSPRSVEVHCQSGTAFRVDDNEAGVSVSELAPLED